MAAVQKLTEALGLRREVTHEIILVSQEVPWLQWGCSALRQHISD